MTRFLGARTLKPALLVLCGLAVFLTALLIIAKRRGAAEADADARPSLMNQPLPAANLVDTGGIRLEDSVLRTGKVVLVFVAPNCPPCDVESEFLKPLLDRRKDVHFYGVVSFGATQASVHTVDKQFPFKVYFDTEPRLAGSLGLYRVPIKLFLEDGIIRKSWKGASTDDSLRAAFTKWLEEVK